MKIAKKLALCVMFPLLCGTASVHAGDANPFNETFQMLEKMAMEKMPGEQRKKVQEMKMKMMQMEMKHQKEMMEMQMKILDIFNQYIS